jgi:hypothetical protein
MAKMCIAVGPGADAVTHVGQGDRGDGLGRGDRQADLEDRDAEQL